MGSPPFSPFLQCSVPFLRGTCEGMMEQWEGEAMGMTGQGMFTLLSQILKRGT
jgi:hypothetical protein